MSNGITIQQVQDVIENMKANNAPEEQITGFLSKAKPNLIGSGSAPDFSTMLQPNLNTPTLGQFTKLSPQGNQRNKNL